MWDEVGTLIDPGNTGIPTVGWTSFRPDLNLVPVDNKYNLVPDAGNIGNPGAITTQTKYLSELATSSYDSSSTAFTEVMYHQSPIDTDVESVHSTAIQCMYKLETQFSDLLNVKVYSPLIQTENANTLSNPIYISIRGTATLFDAYLDAKIIYDYTTNHELTTLDSEVNVIHQRLKEFVENSNRPIHIIGHSLGAIIGLHLLYKFIVQETPNLDQIEHHYKGFTKRYKT